MTDLAATMEGGITTAPVDGAELGHDPIPQFSIGDIRPSPENDERHRPVDEADPQIIRLSQGIVQHGIQEPLRISEDACPTVGMLPTPEGNRCVVCGKMFDSFRPDVAKYCSYRCTNDAYIAWRKEHRRSLRRKTCCHCRRLFEARRADAKYCSAACRQGGYRQRVTAPGCGKIAATGNRNDTGATERGIGGCSEDAALGGDRGGDH